MEEERQWGNEGRQDQSLPGSAQAVNACGCWVVDVGNGHPRKNGSGKELLLTWKSSHGCFKVSILPSSPLHKYCSSMWPFKAVQKNMWSITAPRAGTNSFFQDCLIFRPLAVSQRADATPASSETCTFLRCQAAAIPVEQYSTSVLCCSLYWGTGPCLCWDCLSWVWSSGKYPELFLPCPKQKDWGKAKCEVGVKEKLRFGVAWARWKAAAWLQSRVQKLSAVNTRSKRDGEK